MPSENHNLEAALLFLERAYDRRTQELAEKIDVKRPTISILLKTRKTTKRNAKALIKLWKKEAGLETDEPEVKASTESTEAKPIGSIPFQGRDWKMQVPFYEDEALTEKALAAARALIKSLDPTPAAPPTALRGTPSVAESVLLSQTDRQAHELHAEIRSQIHGDSHSIVPFQSEP